MDGDGPPLNKPGDDTEPLGGIFCVSPTEKIAEERKIKFNLMKLITKFVE